MSLQTAFPVQHQYSDPAFNQSSWAPQTYASAAALGTTALGGTLATPHASLSSSSTAGTTSSLGTASTNASSSPPSQATLYNGYNSAGLDQGNVLNATNQFGYNMPQVSPGQHGVTPQQSAVWARHAQTNKMSENLSSWHENYR